MKNIPLIDIFAGPGGLGEGFSKYMIKEQYPFSICLSIEMDEFAHATLLLRSFYRQFHNAAPKEYYSYLRGEISREKLFAAHPHAAEKACAEAMHAELGGKNFPPEVIDKKIAQVLGKEHKWVLIGGPPCQAYSIVGRARRRNDKGFYKDPKHYLYKEYLRILAKHSPAAFVMENVKGILSAREESGDPIFDKIIKDLCHPNLSIGNVNGKHWNYRIYSLVSGERQLSTPAPADFVVRCEDYGIPQARHRVIILGIREDIEAIPKTLIPQKRVPIQQVLYGIPKIHSELSRRERSEMSWGPWIKHIEKSLWFSELDNASGIKGEIRRKIKECDEQTCCGSDNFPIKSKAKYRADWFLDNSLQVTLNHKSRTHMASDLHRYFFCSCFAELYGRSPNLSDFPLSLLPKHKNVSRAIKDSPFLDRFRVQVSSRPATTITSHISKDGHYFIHPDPTQCRSFTVREAARIQTFPDNYFFEGPRTKQFHQVGNAVPPLLAYQIAEIVFDLLKV